MLAKLYTASRVATLLVIALSFSCNRGDDKGPVATPSQSSSGIQASVIASQPKPRAEEIKEYNGVPWGIDFEKFKELKGLSGKLEYPSLPAAIEFAIDVPIYSACDACVSSFQAILPEIYEIYMGGMGKRSEEDDDVYYFFYSNKFIMAFTYLHENDYANYVKVLSDKYILTSQKEKTYRSVDGIEKAMITSFQAKNVKIFLVNFFGSTSVLYIPNEYYEYYIPPAIAPLSTSLGVA